MHVIWKEMKPVVGLKAQIMLHKFPSRHVILTTHYEINQNTNVEIHKHLIIVEWKQYITGHMHQMSQSTGHSPLCYVES